MCLSFISIDLLDRIAADLRSVVPPTAVAPSEPQHYPMVGEVRTSRSATQSREYTVAHCILILVSVLIVQ